MHVFNTIKAKNYVTVYKISREDFYNIIKENKSAQLFWVQMSSASSGRKGEGLTSGRGGG